MCSCGCIGNEKAIQDTDGTSLRPLIMNAKRAAVTASKDAEAAKAGRK